MKRIGLYGGTFDPIHIAHLHVAQQALEEADLDEIVFLPAGDPPHKGVSVTDVKHRLEMVSRAVKENAHFSVSDWEIQAQGISYTVRTIQSFQRNHPDICYFLIIGEDSLAHIEEWYHWEELLSLVDVLVLRRPNSGIDVDIQAAFYNEKGYRIRVLGTNPLPISSQEIRNMMAVGRSPQYLLPESVWRYIVNEELYVSK